MSTIAPTSTTNASASESSAILSTVVAFGPVLAMKLYRVSLDRPATVPTLPCLDHEAKLHETVAPHIAVYLRDASSGELHEVVFTPSRQRVDIDAVSTIGERSDDSDTRLDAFLRERFPTWRVRVQAPSRWRGDRRVAAACRAQITLREVLLGENAEQLERRVMRLQMIATLMEKQSRVASWAVRTVTGPVIATVGFLVYGLLGQFSGSLNATSVAIARYSVVGGLGAIFLYYGMKAVQLTEMANRVWKRSAEYSLILAGRKRLGLTPPAPPAG